MGQIMTDRVFNFSAGPAVLPLAVLEEAQRDLLALPGAGASILEISHRSKQFVAIVEETESNLRRLLAIPDQYRVLFLQGGSRLQFSMVPMNLLRGNGAGADYLVTGSWGQKARDEALREGKVNIAWDGAETGYDRLPPPESIQLTPGAAYLHFTSNETIEGVQFPTQPDSGGVPLVCDASSDFLSRPVDIGRYGLIYACAQKNSGPAGVTIVVIRDDLLERASDDLPSMLNYRNYAKHNSLFNTPPCFAIYVTMLVTRWLLNDVGGLERMAERNRAKAELLYRMIDSSGGFYKGHSQPQCRSVMNVTFRLPSPELETEFLSAAARRSLASLGGHRSVGGIRASIYNAMPTEGVEALRDFMVEFKDQHAG